MALTMYHGDRLHSEIRICKSLMMNGKVSANACDGVGESVWNSFHSGGD